LSNASHWEKPAAPLSLNRFPREAMTEMRKLFASLLACASRCRLHRRPGLQTSCGPRFPAPIVVTKAAKAESRLIGRPKMVGTFFATSKLQSLIRTALQHNYASASPPPASLTPRPNSASRRSDQFPSVDGGAGLSSQRHAKSPSFRPLQQSYGPIFSFRRVATRFLGKISAGATEAARASLLASEWGRRAVVSSLVASVARLISSFARWTFSLEISKNALTARRESLRLTTALSDRGNTSQLDVRQGRNNSFTPPAKKSMSPSS